MPRRQSVAHHACDLCRQRKRKCDGDGVNPCRACHDGGSDCVYLVPPRVSKAELREEVARLQSINSDNNALLDAISSRQTSPAQLSNILQRLSDGHSRADVAEMLTQTPGSRDGTSWGGSSASVAASASPMSHKDLLLSTRNSSKRSLSLDATPPAVASPPQTHAQVDMVYYRSQMPLLLDVILARDCLTFCPINKNDFTRDFESGANQHCSTALLDALLALATLLVQDKMAAIVASRSKDHPPKDLGDTFAQEAIACLYSRVGLPHSTADIQALGILALYCLGCARMKDGLGFASDFGAAIAEQWAARQSEPVFENRQTYASIYCAAVSFNRSLFLIEDSHKTLDELAIEAGLERRPLHDSSSNPDKKTSRLNLSGSIIDDAFFTRNLGLLPNNPKVIAAKLFEFTEWVYKTRYSTKKSFEQAVKVYQDGLRWYESFFAYTSSCTNETPLILFAHTYYQFGVMCLLTPYVLESTAIALDGTLPMVVCRQAAGNIAQLIEHYSKLYNDGELLDFMPFFKTAALAFLEICDAETPV